MKKETVGIILAAGRGSRLKSFNKPKGNLKINKKLTLIDNIVKNFRENGVSKIILVTGYKSYLIKNNLFKKIFNKKWKTSTMISSLLCAKSYLNRYNCIVSYSDIYFESDAITKLKNCKNEIGITFYSQWLSLWKKRYNDPLSDLEQFKTNNRSFISLIGNKARSLKEIQGQYMGLLFFKPSGWKKIKKLINNLNYLKKMSITDVLNEAVKNKIKIKAFKYNNLFFEIDTNKDLIVARDKFQEKNLT